ncbi:MAG: hypothetical protein ACRDLY_01675 [Thermoleophilaceae bacterium]
MKSLIAVAVTILVVGATSATAATLITSKQIKDNSVRSKDVRNGTLLLKDFKASQRAKLRGPAGQQGVQGVPGNPATDTDTNVSFEYVNGPVVSVAPGTANSSAAVCPEGRLAVGGSFGPQSQAFGVDDAWFFDVTPGAFTITAFNSDTAPRNLQARAVCVVRTRVR